ncbi:MAG: YqgE/AlgH family protein [Bacteroidales bacterium]
MDLNIDFFRVINDKKAEKGRILISEPFLSDTYFKRSVVFLTENNEEGSVGFVLNKPIELKLKDVLQDFPETDSGISVGGPVNTNTVHYIHTLGARLPESIQVTKNIWWGGSFDVLKEMALAGAIKANELRFFLGYSGWSPNQLDNELQENAWLIGEISDDMIMAGIQADFWNEVLKKMQNKYKVWANFPENPGMN